MIFRLVHDIVESESRINNMLPKCGCAPAGAYDLSSLEAMDVRTHPQVITGGILRDNPFDLPPSELLHDPVPAGRTVRFRQPPRADAC